MTSTQPASYSTATDFPKFQSLGTLAAVIPISAGRSSSGREQVRIGAPQRGIGKVITFGAAAFRRDIMLPRLIPVGPEEIADRTLAGRSRILRRLARALRGERTRGRAGHWTYSLDRHVGLLQAFKAKRAALRRICATDAGAMAAV